MFQWEEDKEEEEKEEVAEVVVDKAGRRWLTRQGGGEPSSLFKSCPPLTMLWIIGLLSQEQTWKLNERAGNAFNPFQTSQSLSFLDFISSDEKNLKNEKIVELDLNFALYLFI